MKLFTTGDQKLSQMRGTLKKRGRVMLQFLFNCLRQDEENNIPPYIISKTLVIAGIII
jgi:hypothetical protein